MMSEKLCVAVERVALWFVEMEAGITTDRPMIIHSRAADAKAAAEVNTNCQENK